MFSVDKMESRLDSLLSRLETRDPFLGNFLVYDFWTPPPEDM